MIAILLSTFNGELYISEQLDSILNQTYEDWSLYIRDDGSSDKTVSIIDDYCRRFPNKMHFLKDDLGNLKPGKSFMHLLSVMKADYYMFCDQDDVWLPTKIERAVSLLLSNSRNIELPIMVISDLVLVDSQLKIQSVSYWNSIGFNVNNPPNIYQILSGDPVAYGCTMLFNSACTKYLFPFCRLLMHDHWSFLIISHYGKVVYDTTAMIHYRQHNNNVTGAYSSPVKNFNFYYSRFLELKQIIRYKYQVYLSIPFRISILKWIYYSMKHNI